LQLAPPEGKSVQPGTLTITITWPHESGTGTCTASAATSGMLSGAGTGNLNVAQNLLSFAPNVLPPVGALLTVDYVAGPKQEDSFAHPSRDGQGKVPVTATLGSIEPGSLEIEWNTLTDTAVLGVYTLQQIQAMGLGLWNGVDPTQYARDDGAGNVLRSGVVIGSVNYATGAVQFQPDVTVKIPSPSMARNASAGLRAWARCSASTTAASVTWMHRRCTRTTSPATSSCATTARARPATTARRSRLARRFGWCRA